MEALKSTNGGNDLKPLLSETDRIAAIVCERFETRNEAGEQRAFDETLQG